MASPRCPYCQQPFQASRYHPDQVVCSGPECQRRRRADYHCQKRENDPLYYEQCLDSQRQWREEHRDYMKNYRRTHRTAPRPSRPERGPSRATDWLLECVKNNVAVELTACGARVWLVAKDKRVKNIVACAQLIVVEALPGDKQEQEGCKEHLFGVSPDLSV